MIEIHRKKRLVSIEGKPVKLSKDEYPLMVAFGMMGNRLVPNDLLLDVMCEGRTQIPYDKHVLQLKMHRLRGKLGPDVIVTKPGIGYRLADDVQFVG